jgi:predicted nucleic acid-binding protein
MLADTTFLIDLAEEASAQRIGPARRFLAVNRQRRIWTTVINLGELAAGLLSNSDARTFVTRYRIARLSPEIAYEAATIDRELIRRGERLGENDNWIAGFARYYGEPVISNDDAFDRVAGVRRISY